MKKFDWDTAKRSLKHVYWIGGSACGGKTTISKRIAEDFGFVRYDGDSHLGDRGAAADEHECPILHKVRTEVGTAAHFRRLLVRKPAAMAEILLAQYREDLLMTAKALLEMPSDNAIIVDLSFGYPIQAVPQPAATV
jgi:hypothetical protein